MLTLGVLASDEYLQDPALYQSLRPDYEVRFHPDWRTWDAATLLQRCRESEVLLTGRGSPRLPLELAQDRGRLRYLCHLYGTIRHLVDKRLIEAGLLVTNWGDNVADVAEGALCLLLCMLKQVVTLDRFTQGGADQRVYQMFPPTLRGRDVGLYGYGPIGRHMARFLEPLGARIAIYDPYAQDVPAHIRRCPSLRELFATCQVISVHCGLNDHTRGSVTAELLALLPQGGVVINTARGAIIDEPALAREVAAGRLLAGLDLIEHEGRWHDSPVSHLPGALLTRHSIGGGKGYPPGHHPERRLADWALDNLRTFAAGQPLKYVITAAEYDLKT